MTGSSQQELNAAAEDANDSPNDSKKAGPRCLVLALLLTVIPLLVAAVAVFVVLVIFANGGLLHSMSSQRLDRLAVEIEAFYMTEGEYPETLKALGLPGNEIYDVTRGLWSSGAAGNFYYRRSENGQAYDVLGVGWDGAPFTDDDLLPDPKLSR